MLHDLFIGRQEIFGGWPHFGEGVDRSPSLFTERNAPTPADVVWMSDTDVDSAQLMHPQESNVHGKIFGG